MTRTASRLTTYLLVGSITGMKTSSTASAILHTARSLILQGGYNSFSYADIAQVVGVRNASIHHHYPSKALLVQAVVAAHRAEVQAGLAALQQQYSDPARQLQAYLDYWSQCIASANTPFCVCALLANELPVLPAEVAGEVRAHFRALASWLTGLLDRAQAVGAFRLQSTASTEAELAMATIHGAMLSARAYADPAMFELIGNQLMARLRGA